MFQTRDDQLQKRRSIKDAYTFRHVGGHLDERVESRRVDEMKRIPTLDINSDVATKLRQLEQTEVLTAPRFDPKEVHRELHASSIRLLKIQNGMPLSAVVRDPGPEYDPLTPRRVTYVNDREILFPHRGYVVPNLKKKSEFVLPEGVEAETPALKAQNQLLRFKNQIYEADRRRINATLDELSRRNKRRPYALSQQYEDYVRFGLKESQRRADRAGRLSRLKERRSEPWWPQIVAQFPKEGRNKADLETLEMLAKVPEFNEKTIGGLYREALERFKNPEPFKQILAQINELGGYLQEYKLMMVFKKAESDRMKQMQREAAEND